MGFLYEAFELVMPANYAKECNFATFFHFRNCDDILVKISVLFQTEV